MCTRVQGDSRTLPAGVRATIAGGCLHAWGREVPLPFIRGQGKFTVLYSGPTLRIFRSGPSCVVQVRGPAWPCVFTRGCRCVLVRRGATRPAGCLLRRATPATAAAGQGRCVGQAAGGMKGTWNEGALADR